MQKEQELEYYTNIKLEFESTSPKEVQQKLEAEGFEDLNDFNKYVTNLDKSLKEL